MNCRYVADCSFIQYNCRVAYYGNVLNIVICGSAARCQCPADCPLIHYSSDIL